MGKAKIRFRDIEIKGNGQFSLSDLIIKKLRQDGKTLAEIGKVYTLSRQRISQIIISQ